MHSATLNMNVLDHPYRAMTVGALALVSVLAFEAMAVTAAMPVVAGPDRSASSGLCWDWVSPVPPTTC